MMHGWGSYCGHVPRAKSDLHIAYEHTSHGSQLITGMNALSSYPDFGNIYEWSDNGSSGLDLDNYGIPGAVSDLSQGDYLDGGVTPWVTQTRVLLDNASNSISMWLSGPGAVSTDTTPSGMWTIWRF